MWLFFCRLWQRCELQQALSRDVALAGQPAAGWVSLLWGSNSLPLLAGDCSTLCSQVRSSRLVWSGPAYTDIYLKPALFLSHRDPRPVAWTVYAATVNPLSTLFTPAHFVSHIVIHEGYNSLTHTGDISLMRLTKPLDFTGAVSVDHLSDTVKCSICSLYFRQGPEDVTDLFSLF